MRSASAKRAASTPTTVFADEHDGTPPFVACFLEAEEQRGGPEIEPSARRELVASRKLVSATEESPNRKR